MVLNEDVEEFAKWCICNEELKKKRGSIGKLRIVVEKRTIST